MADQTRFIQDLDKIKSSLQDTSKPLVLGGYIARIIPGFFYFNRVGENKDSETKWKVHVSILPPKRSETDEKDNLKLGWQIFSELAIKHQIDSFKVVDTGDPGFGKQITIYCNKEDELLIFLKELDEVLKARKIKADIGKPLDCTSVPGSNYITFRYELFNYNLEKTSIAGAPKNYISDMHIDLAKEVVSNIKTLECDFEAAYNRAFRYGKNSFWHTKYLNELKRDFNTEIFKQEMQLIVTCALSHEEGVIPWHNLQKLPDIFALGAFSLGEQVEEKVITEERSPAMLTLHDAQTKKAPSLDQLSASSSLGSTVATSTVPSTTTAASSATTTHNVEKRSS